MLLLSSNLDEILALGDTILVMYRGRIVGRLTNNKEVSKELIGEYMMGLRDDSGRQDEADRVEVNRA